MAFNRLKIDANVIYFRCFLSLLPWLLPHTVSKMSMDANRFVSLFSYSAKRLCHHTLLCVLCCAVSPSSKKKKWKYEFVIFILLAFTRQSSWPFSHFRYTYICLECDSHASHFILLTFSSPFLRSNSEATKPSLLSRSPAHSFVHCCYLIGIIMVWQTFGILHVDVSVSHYKSVCVAVLLVAGWKCDACCRCFHCPR